jgi:hypothetical protein
MGEIVHTLIEVDPDDFDAEELADALNAMRAAARKRKMREELRVENPDLTDEGFEAQWELLEALGLDD